MKWIIFIYPTLLWSFTLPWLIGRSFDGKQFPLGQLNKFPLERNHFPRITLDGEVFEAIEGSVPPYLRKKIIRFLPTVLELSRRYRIDPFWTLSIMWVESSFNPHVQSASGAYGPMQIMPRTAIYLWNYIQDREKWAWQVPYRFPYRRELRKNPRINIALGVFYLRYLFDYYNHDFIRATVAYNMGPGNIQRRERLGLPIGVKNRYLNRVRKAYKALTGGSNQRLK